LALVVLSTGDEIINAVSSSTSEGNITFVRIVRLLKVAKILRALRVVRVFKELAVLVESLAKCIFSVFWAFMMLLLVLYMFTLLFMQGLIGTISNHQGWFDTKKVDTLRAYFGSVQISMVSLYMAVTGGNDWTVYYDSLQLAGHVYGLLFIVYIFLSLIAIMNLLTGMFVEKAVRAAMPDREELILEQHKAIIEQAKEFRKLCRALDLDKTGTISFQDFAASLKDETIVAHMVSIGLEIRDVELFFNSVSGGGTSESIDYDLFVDGCMAMRGAATSLDMQKQLHETRKLMAQIASFESSCGAKLEKHLRLLLSVMQQQRVVDKPVAAAHVHGRLDQPDGRTGNISPLKKSKTLKTIERGDVLQLRAFSKSNTIGPASDGLGQGIGDTFANPRYQTGKGQSPRDKSASPLGLSTLNSALDKRLTATGVYNNPPPIEPPTCPLTSAQSRVVDSNESNSSQPTATATSLLEIQAQAPPEDSDRIPAVAVSDDLQVTGDNSISPAAIADARQVSGTPRRRKPGRRKVHSGSSRSLDLYEPMNVGIPDISNLNGT